MWDYNCHCEERSDMAISTVDLQTIQERLLRPPASSSQRQLGYYHICIQIVGLLAFLADDTML